MTPTSAVRLWHSMSKEWRGVVTVAGCEWYIDDDMPYGYAERPLTPEEQKELEKRMAEHLRDRRAAATFLRAFADAIEGEWPEEES